MKGLNNPNSKATNSKLNKRLSRDSFAHLKRSELSEVFRSSNRIRLAKHEDYLFCICLADIYTSDCFVDGWRGGHLLDWTPVITALKVSQLSSSQL
jgi:hypothetical protein